MPQCLQHFVLPVFTSLIINPVVFSYIDLRLDYMTCQWDLSKYETSRGLKALGKMKLLALILAFLLPS